MDYMDSELCYKCGRLVLRADHFNHEILCQGFGEYSHQYGKTMGFELSNLSQYSNENTYDETKSAQRKGMMNTYATVKCPKCKDLFTINEYVYHRRVCNYMACYCCNEFFPRVLIDHHFMICPQREHLNSAWDSFDDDEYSVDTFNRNPLLQRNAEYLNPEMDNRSISNNIHGSINNEDDSQVPFLLRNNDDRSNNRRRNGILRLPVRITYHTNNPEFQFHPDAMDLVEHRAFMIINRIFAEDFFTIIDQFMNLFHNPETGLQEEEIERFSIEKYVKLSNTPFGEEDKCPICIVDFEGGNEIRRLPCGHFFHPTCIDTWLIQNCRCPVCKNDLTDYTNNNN